MPPLKNIRKNFAILSDDETAIIASTLENDNSNLTLRDKVLSFLLPCIQVCVVVTSQK